MGVNRGKQNLCLTTIRMKDFVMILAIFRGPHWMAFSVPIGSSSVIFPEICPFCEARNRTRWIRRGHSRLTGYYLLYFTYSTAKLQFPICTVCRSKALSLLWVGIAMVVTAALIPGEWKRSVATFFVLAGLALLAYRVWWLSKVIPIVLGNGDFIIVTRSVDYARQLATANDTTFEPFMPVTLT